MKLFSKESFDLGVLEGWHKEAILAFEKKMANKNELFPCIPATIGHRLQHFRYGFVSDPEKPSSIDELSQILEEYSRNYQKIGNYTSLIVFYEPSISYKNIGVETFEQLFWEQLAKLSKQDIIEWPNHIPKDPHNSLWEFCFHGEQYFVYCATPAHKNRKSRYFPYFMLAITPRWALDQLYSSNKDVSLLKENIRKRIIEYDSAPIHPDLKTYGQEDNLEWRQYFLRDDDSSLSKCPFHQILSESKKEVN